VAAAIVPDTETWMVWFFYCIWDSREGQRNADLFMCCNGGRRSHSTTLFILQIDANRFKKNRTAFRSLQKCTLSKPNRGNSDLTLKVVEANKNSDLFMRWNEVVNRIQRHRAFYRLKLMPCKKTWLQFHNDMYFPERIMIWNTHEEEQPTSTLIH